MYCSSVMYRKDADTDIFKIKDRAVCFNFYKAESQLHNRCFKSLSEYCMGE